MVLRVGLGGTFIFTANQLRIPICVRHFPRGGGALPQFLYAGVPLWDLEPLPFGKI